MPCLKKLKPQSLVCSISYILLITLCSFPIYGNTEGEPELRTWTSTVGTTMEAQLIKIQSDSVILKNSNGRQMTVKLSQLVKKDRDYVAAQPSPRGNVSVKGLEAKPGIISDPITCIKKEEWSYHLYLPEDFHDGRVWPVWFIMSPVGAKFMNDLRRYTDGAEKLGCILAFSIESRNDFPDSELAVSAMVDDVFERLPVVPALAFATGFSGGSRMAYLTAERDRRIAGVLACGSGHGVYPKGEGFRLSDLRNSTYVYSLIGTTCCNRTGAAQSHMKFPDNYRLRFFPGGHVWADADYISQGMARVLGAGLERMKDRSFEKMRVQFAQKMLGWAKGERRETPWESYYWANYLKDFPSNSTIEGEARSLESSLAANPNVQSAMKAEKALREFAEDHFKIGYKADQNPDKEREKDAARLSEKYKDSPHGLIFECLADPCSF